MPDRDQHSVHVCPPAVDVGATVDNPALNVDPAFDDSADDHDDGHAADHRRRATQRAVDNLNRARDDLEHAATDYAESHHLGAWDIDHVDDVDDHLRADRLRAAAFEFARASRDAVITASAEGG